MKKLTSIEERFWKYVVKSDDCWLWTGGTRVGRYGGISLGRRGEGIISTHRFSYQLHKGKIPKGKIIMHKCDNPLCVKPDHLFMGTQKDNVLDMIAKGRQGKTGAKKGTGSRNHLTMEQANNLREEYKSGVSQVKLADKYGLGQSTVSRIIRQQTFNN